MSAKDRSCFNGDGLPKVRFNSRAAANERSRARGIDAQAYRCPTCGYFHLGHYPANKLTRYRLKKAHRS